MASRIARSAVSLSFLLSTLMGACVPPPAGLGVAPETFNDHQRTRELSVYHTIVLLDESVANAPVAMGSDGMAREVSNFIVRADDVRRPDVDLCCHVFIREDYLHHSLSTPDPDGLYFGAIGALSAEDDPQAPVAYFVERFTRLSHTAPDGEVRLFDGFPSVDQMFELVNTIPAAPLSRASYEHFLNPPPEPDEGDYPE